MSTKQSDEKEGGGFVSTQVCNATKEELKKDGFGVARDCPLCADKGMTLKVGNHRSDQATGNKNNGVDALNLFVPLYVSHLMSPLKSLYISHLISPSRCLL
jgi:hypothetical protein